MKTHVGGAKLLLSAGGIDMFEKCASDNCHHVEQQLCHQPYQEFLNLAYPPTRESCFVINMGLNLGYFFWTQNPKK